MFNCLLMGQVQPVELTIPVSSAFRFVAYGDTRFTDPEDTTASNPSVRRALVAAIGAADPAFISIGGDITYVGANANDWKVWDQETVAWHDHHIPILPALGNHDLKGDESAALGNYYARFPELKNSRFYSVRIANTLMLVLDSSLEEISGAQGTWLNSKLDLLPGDIDFVFIVLHHPPYTSSSSVKLFGGGHSARTPEQELANMLERRQATMRARFVVFSGHIHNYERHQHGGVLYFVTGGGGAHAYPIEREASDPFQSKGINYHYLLVQVDGRALKITMHRLEADGDSHTWTQPDRVEIEAPAAASVKAAGSK
jgi:calcineurin-like phosphoesterase family protein